MRLKTRALLLLTGAMLATPSSMLGQVSFDGRVLMRLSERWDIVPGLPTLLLNITTVHEYPSTGYCLQLSSLRRNDTLEVTLKSVIRCGDLVGYAFTPAARTVRLGRVDSSEVFPRTIRLKYKNAQDDYTLQSNPQGGRLVPMEPVTFTNLAESRRLRLMQRNWVSITCHAPHRRTGCLCEELLYTALFRGHMSPEPLTPGEVSTFQPRGRSDSTGSSLGTTFVAAQGVRIEELRALAEDFTRVFEGGNADAGQNPSVSTAVALWDGRGFSCWAGTCRQGY